MTPRFNWVQIPDAAGRLGRELRRAPAPLARKLQLPDHAPIAKPSLTEKGVIRDLTAAIIH